ncbi:GNAT family N-acetyltransferase [Caldovatus aquaticus]|uniref:GNAT family N-acetyltransferase n=1 Tax=Caldovatus aquaticus TaxID=2865671 RepID=A0ABS7EXL4_9PROT|nr:GNAT family N-acetyltransferase [Caldovatus aquaticus]MBW8268096.1 GNAT family N-acetyltransferase [Caldovatus aquaticus]
MSGPPAASPPPGIAIRPPEAWHRADWERLYAGYAAFYKTAQTPEMRARVWSWIRDPAHEVKALIAETAEGRAVGLAHYRPFARPLSASVGGFLDDLFVEEAHRGRGIAEALIAAVAEIGCARGWSLIRWITADDNYRARSVYDRLATRTFWITYDLKLPG